jgi:hypothetical protein
MTSKLPATGLLFKEALYCSHKTENSSLTIEKWCSHIKVIMRRFLCFSDDTRF